MTPSVKPKTLAEAREMLATAHEQIGTITEELKQPKSAPAKIVAPAPLAAVTPKPPVVTKLPAYKPIKEQTVEELRSALSTEKDPNARFNIHKVLKARETSGLEATSDQSPPLDPASSPTWEPVIVRHAPLPKSLPVS